jgi:hypothetical protein
MVINMKKTSIYGVLVLTLVASLIGAVNGVFAQTTPGSDFGLQVSPSPLVQTIKPGVTQHIDLTIRNSGTGTERLVIRPREFDVDKKTGEVTLKETAPKDVTNWFSFSDPTFTVKPGEVFTQKITANLPSQSGFSYSFALVISRASNDEVAKSGAILRGSVAVFTLINVDRPGATRKFDVTDFKPKQVVYEYLPAEFDISFHNTGNTILRPVGNVFIQRGSNDKNALATIPVNPGDGYLLPDRPRTLTTEWSGGFPEYKTITTADGQKKRNLNWDWSKLTDFRIGQYTAKLVAVYNDGQRDVPIMREVTFWVFPWRLILGAIVIIAIFSVGAWVILRKTRSVLRRSRK